MIERYGAVSVAEPVTKYAVAEPIRRLMLDVLRTAIGDAVGGYHGDDAERAQQESDARAWLRDKSRLSVLDCCDALGINYEAMRKVLEADWKVAKKRLAASKRALARGQGLAKIGSGR